MRQRDWLHVRTDTPRVHRLHVIFCIAEKHRVHMSDIFDHVRTPHIVKARWEAVVAVHRQFGDNSVRLGRLFNRDHTTIAKVLRGAQ